MANNIDEKVKQLFDVVQKKKKEIEKIEKRPNWISNCSFSYNPQLTGDRINIQVINDVYSLVSIVSFLLDKKEHHSKACEILDVEIPFKWMGYSAEDWINDAKTRVDKINLSEKKKTLESLEKRLNSLVSKEMRDKMEIEAIEKELNLGVNL